MVGAKNFFLLGGRKNNRFWTNLKMVVVFSEEICYLLGQGGEKDVSDSSYVVRKIPQRTGVFLYVQNALLVALEIATASCVNHSILGLTPRGRELNHAPKGAACASDGSKPRHKLLLFGPYTHRRLTGMCPDRLRPAKRNILRYGFLYYLDLGVDDLILLYSRLWQMTALTYVTTLYNACTMKTQTRVWNLFYHDASSFL